MWAIPGADMAAHDWLFAIDAAFAFAFRVRVAAGASEARPVSRNHAVAIGAAAIVAVERIQHDQCKDATGAGSCTAQHKQGCRAPHARPTPEKARGAS